MNKQNPYALWGALAVLPTLIVWITGFLGAGLHNTTALGLLQAFHAWPQWAQVVVEFILPAAGFILGVLSYRQAGNKKMSIAVLAVSGILLLFAVGGIILISRG